MGCFATSGCHPQRAAYIKTPLQNVITWGTTGLIIALCTVMLASILLPHLGIPLLQ
jgi:hypothetical protein